MFTWYTDIKAATSSSNWVWERQLTRLYDNTVVIHLKTRENIKLLNLNFSVFILIQKYLTEKQIKENDLIK